MKISESAFSLLHERALSETFSVLHGYAPSEFLFTNFCRFCFKQVRSLTIRGKCNSIVIFATRHYYLNDLLHI
jgi:hypothetical protein